MSRRHRPAHQAPFSTSEQDDEAAPLAVQRPAARCVHAVLVTATEPLSVGAIAEVVDLSRRTIQDALATLEGLGLASRTRTGHGDVWIRAHAHQPASGPDDAGQAPIKSSKSAHDPRTVIVSLSSDFPGVLESIERPWAPPPGPSDRRELKRVVQDDGLPRVWCRQVRLWGRNVWLDDESGRVWCPSCKRLVDVEELGRLDNRHDAIGLPPRAEGRLLPMRDDEPGPRDRWPDDAA